MSIEKIVDTYSECFEMWFSRILITASKKALAYTAAQNTVGFATSIIMCPAEAGMEQFLPSHKTPDQRPGYIIQIWARSQKKLHEQVLTRISQCALTTATTNIFNYSTSGKITKPIGKLIAYYGDGYQSQAKKYGRTGWLIPVFDGQCFIENVFSYDKGIAGGLLILIGKTQKDLLPIVEDIIHSIKQSALPIITPFPGGFCRAGSKIGSTYSFLKESTNHHFCPTLKQKIDQTLLPQQANCAYEIVINAISEDTLRRAMRIGIETALEKEKIIQITSANYKGQLGSYKIPLRQLVTE
ncbi:MAG: formylmethanofuran--tetrahydromethanopterin N-formyltransferase [Asgard group archaeon]|nr:formylmethanofuran--tetrahydromethanopterin N-formyltransferase [Asgard group archaeon]